MDNLSQALADITRPSSLVVVPFSGFYNSWHDDALDRALEMMFSDRDTGCHVNEELQGRAFDCIEWQAVHVAYSVRYCEAFAEEFGVRLKWESLSSPREYNFSTDRIFAEWDNEDIARVFKETPREILDTIAEEMFTSRSGFASFYSPDVAEWGDLSEWDHNQRFALLRAHVRHVKGKDLDSYGELDLMESDMGNGFADDVLFSTASGEANAMLVRLCNVWYYLDDTRKNR